jgi:glutathione S-transferase
MARMDEIDAELGAEKGPYFLSSFSLVDCVFCPFLERIAASIPYYKVCSRKLNFCSTDNSTFVWARPPTALQLTE